MVNRWAGGEVTEIYWQLPNLILEVPKSFVCLFSVAVLIAYLKEYVAM